MLTLSTPARAHAEMADYPFDDEREIEDYIAANPGAIGLIHILGRQKKTPAGTPDLTGVDAEGWLVVVEIKHLAAGRAAVAQIANYANWFDTADAEAISRYLARCRKAKTGAAPFSRQKPAKTGTCPPQADYFSGSKKRALSLRFCESEASAGKGGKEFLPDLPLKIRGIVVAPGVHPSGVRVANGLNYPVSFYVVRRWSASGGKGNTKKSNSIILTLPYTGGEDGTPYLLDTAGRKSDEDATAEWTPARYAAVYKGATVEEFLRRTDELEEFAAAKGWQASKILRKDYSCFKRLAKKGGRRRAFGVRFISRVSVVYYFVLPKETAERLGPEPMRNYYNHANEAWFTIKKGETDLSTFARLLAAAWDYNV